jgi:phage gp46-like protein
MATSDIDIVNRALTMLGVDPINSLSDSTKAASTANRLFNDTRAAVFRGHPWNCLIKRASLPQEAQAPLYGYAYAFTLPADFLRLLSIENNLGKYSIEGRKILYDDEILQITYIALVTDVIAYDTLLTDALAARLAADMAHPLLQSTEAMERMYNLYELKLREAKFVDAQENAQDVLDTDYWLDSRTGVTPSWISTPPRY